MTVRELIIILLENDLDLTVLVDSYEYGCCDIEKANIRKIRYERDSITSDHGGPHRETGKGECVGLVIGRG